MRKRVAWVLGGLLLVATPLVGLAGTRLLPSLLSWPVQASAWTTVASVATLAAACCASALLGLVVSGTVLHRERTRRLRIEARMARLLQGAHQADTLVTIVNRSGRIEYVNRAVEAATGYSARELLGRRSGPGLPWHPEGPSREELWARLLAGESFRGLVSCTRKDGAPFLLDEHVAPLEEGQGRAMRFISTALDVTRQKRTEERLAYVSSFDTLTGVANRARFSELLQRQLESESAAERRIDLMVMDVDRFKYVNDVHTPEVGDAVLRRIAELLRASVGPDGIIGRLGSDEFGVIHRRSGTSQVLEVAHAVRGALAQDADAATQHPAVTVTIGIASCPRDGRDATTLLKNADVALARAKSLGRGSIQSFSRELSDQVLESYLMQRHLAFALGKGEYDVHYQPYCDLSTGKVAGAEALIRWNRGELGLVSPVKFIPALEDTGLILAVGEWVLKTVCRQISDWQKTERPLAVAVNVSQSQFGQRNLAQVVADAVAGHAIDPRYLTLELTESMCVRDESFAMEQMGQLKDVGVSLSVDDFGTGYSSLSHVKKLPIDTLKIDSSFVRDVTRDPDAASIVSAITNMARSLGLKTIAEGVESEEQRNILRLLRCDMGQGYHFSPAVAADDLERMIAS